MKPMTSIGQGVREIRIQEERQWRIIYHLRRQIRGCRLCFARIPEKDTENVKARY